MRLKHLYYRTDNHRVSKWNCDTCDTSCRWRRSSITDAPRSVCASRNPRFPDRFRIWKKRSVSSCLTAFHAAGKSFLVDARRILHEVNEAAARAKRVASGQSGTLRVGFVESVSWHGVVPDSFRQFRERQPDVELQLKPASSMEQTEAVLSGRLDAGFVFTIAHIGHELAQLPVASLNLMLAAPKGHPLTKLKTLRLRDLSDAAFVWFPRRESPAYYDRLMHECFRGGLKSPHIVQEAVNEATILSLVSCRMGVAFVSGATRWRCPESVALLPVTDLKLPLPFALVWRRDNASALLAKFVADVRQLPEVEAFANR